MKQINVDWFIAAGIRAVKTMVQTALGLFTVGAAVSDVQWKQVISVSVVSGVYSLLTSIATKLPEVSIDGSITVDTSNELTKTYQVDMEESLPNIKNKKVVTLKVK